jgi:multimeric flavodoxin WrbA
MKNGNSERLTQLMINEMEKFETTTKWFKISDLTIHGCLGCDHCTDNSGICCINDDMHKIYNAYEWCDAVIISTPVYTRNASSHIFAVMDRSYAMKDMHYLDGKLGAAIAVGKGAGQAIAIKSIYSWYLSSGMLCIPGELNGITATHFEPGDKIAIDKYSRKSKVMAENMIKYLKMVR